MHNSQKCSKWADHRFKMERSVERERKGLVWRERNNVVKQLRGGRGQPSKPHTVKRQPWQLHLSSTTPFVHASFLPLGKHSAPKIHKSHLLFNLSPTNTKVNSGQSNQLMTDGSNQDPSHIFLLLNVLLHLEISLILEVKWVVKDALNEAV